jgi:hypothetical protein
MKVQQGSCKQLRQSGDMNEAVEDGNFHFYVSVDIPHMTQGISHNKWQKVNHTHSLYTMPNGPRILFTTSTGSQYQYVFGVRTISVY